MKLEDEHRLGSPRPFRQWQPDQGQLLPLGWLNRERRLSKDYERLEESSEACRLDLAVNNATLGDMALMPLTELSEEDRESG